MKRAEARWGSEFAPRAPTTAATSEKRQVTLQAVAKWNAREGRRLPSARQVEFRSEGCELRELRLRPILGDGASTAALETRSSRRTAPTGWRGVPAAQLVLPGGGRLERCAKRSRLHRLGCRIS